jgi:predicted dinucleotide-binding enzyme
MARIAVIGAGHIGGTLGDIWQRTGHVVTFGVREPEGRGGDGQTFATPEEAIDGADIVLFAVPAAAMEAMVADLGRLIRGNVVIDATNSVGRPKMYSQALRDLAVKGTPVYRAFNSLGFENLKDPHYGDDVADLFYAGPEGPGRAAVEALIADVGLRPIYVGTDPDLVDGVLRLWFALAIQQKMGRGLAFKVLQR